MEINMKKIKWGVIGCGGIADRRTIPGMMLTSNCELVAVMDTNYEVAQKVAAKYGAKIATADYREILANESFFGQDISFLTEEVEKCR